MNSIYYYVDDLNYLNIKRYKVKAQSKKNITKYYVYVYAFFKYSHYKII